MINHRFKRKEKKYILKMDTAQKLMVVSDYIESIDNSIDDPEIISSLKMKLLEYSFKKLIFDDEEPIKSSSYMFKEVKNSYDDIQYFMAIIFEALMIIQKKKTKDKELEKLEKKIEKEYQL